MKNSHKNQSFKNIVGAIVMAILFICIIAVIATGFIFKSKSSTPSVFGYNVYIMEGKGMEPFIPDKSAVFAIKGPLPEGENAVGRAVLCNIVDNELTTVLRVYGIEEIDGATNYIMKSDAAPDTQMISVSKDKVIGEAVRYDKFLGKAIVFVTSKVGMIVLVIFPSTIIIILYLLSVLRKVKNDESEYGLPCEDEEDNSNDNNEDDEDDEPEIIEQVSKPAQVIVDAKGEAQYDIQKPTKSNDVLDGVLYKPQTKVNKQQNKPYVSKSFEFKATSDDIKQVKKPQFATEKRADTQADMFMPPRNSAPKARKSSNQTIEELMKMLDQKENEIKK